MLNKCPFDNATACGFPEGSCDGCPIKNNLDLKNEIIRAFIELIDGNTPKDISYFSGISLERSKEIYNIWLQYIKLHKV